MSDRTQFLAFILFATIFTTIDVNASGTQLRRIWLQDFCNNNICQGVHILKNDYVIFAHTPIAGQTSLTFMNSTITKIPHLLFDTFPDLQLLKIENCSLETFERPQFEGATFLMSLYLGNNLLKDIPRNVFLGAHNLNKLSLENNQIRTLHNQSFHPLKELNFLSLEGNQLEFLTVGIFSSLRKLHELNLAKNKLTDIPMGIFQKNTHISIINLSENHLHKFDSNVFKSLQRLSTLSVSGNVLQEIALNLSKIETFVANDCDLRKIEFFGYLREISLRNNSLREVPHFPHTENLTSIDLSVNPLGTLHPNAFKKIVALIRLNLSATNLHDLPEGIFKKQINLRHLDISNNSLYNLRISLFDNLKFLEFFHFQKNNWNCDFLQLLMSSFVKRKDIVYDEDDIEPDLVDDFIDGMACWYENNKSPRKCDSGGEQVLELAIIRNDIKGFVDAVDRKFTRLFRLLDEMKSRI